MPLSSELIAQFVKTTKDTTNDRSGAVVYGTVGYNTDEGYYVILDGSDIHTPIAQTADVKAGDRVTVMIKDHTAVVNGNVSSPAARTGDTGPVVTTVSEFEMVGAAHVSADTIQAMLGILSTLTARVAEIEELQAASADIDELSAILANLKYVTAEDLTAINAKIESLEVIFGQFEDLTAEHAEIANLKGYTADFTYVSAEVLEAVTAKMNALTVNKLDANFANIDYASIENATIEDLYAKFGLIENATMKDGYVTGKLVAVEINGDYIRSGTIQADRLLILGQNGLYYQLNVNGGMDPTVEEVPADSIHGSIIAAKSITADQIKVTDLQAFGANIGGFIISENAIYSRLKPDIGTGDGLYMDDEGQLSIGSDDSYLRFYKDGFTYRHNAQDPGEITEDIKASATFVKDLNETTKVYSYTDADQVTRYFTIDSEKDVVTPVDQVDKYRLAISADALYFGEDSKLYADQLKGLVERIKLGTVKNEEGDEKPCIELSEGDTNFKQVITNVKTTFMDGPDVKTEINTDGLETENVAVKKEFRHAGFVWAGRANGNYGLSWNGGVG